MLLRYYDPEINDDMQGAICSVGRRNGSNPEDGWCTADTGGHFDPKRIVRGLTRSKGDRGHDSQGSNMSAIVRSARLVGDVSKLEDVPQSGRKRGSAERL
jgi:hypothetical protein